MQARGVSVALVGERKVRRGKETRTERVFEFAQPLDGEKSYAPGGSEYCFATTMPESLREQLPQAGKMSFAVKLGSLLFSQSPVRWYLDAKLDVPKSVDMSKRVQISIV